MTQIGKLQFSAQTWGEMRAHRSTKGEACLSMKGINITIVEVHVFRGEAATEDADIPIGRTGVQIRSWHNLRAFTQGIGQPQLNIVTVDRHGRIRRIAHAIEWRVHCALQTIAKVQSQTVAHGNTQARSQLRCEGDARIIPLLFAILLAADKSRSNTAAHIERPQAGIDVFPEIGEQEGCLGVVCHRIKGIAKSKAGFIIFIALI